MILSQISTYRSITSLADTTLPAFTLITGVNGSGKSHLLQAIEEGAVKVDCAPNPKNDIRRFDWTSFVPNNAGSSTIQQLHQVRDKICSIINKEKSLKTEDLKTVLRTCGIMSHFSTEPWSILNFNDEQLAEIISDSSDVKRVHQQIHRLGTEVTANVKRQLQQDAQASTVLDTIGQTQKYLANIDEEFFDTRPFGWDKEDIFKQSFASLFLAYSELRKNNDLRCMYAQQGRELDKEPMDDQEFKNKYGDPPWDVVNSILTDASLDFEIDHPISLESTTYKPILRKKSTRQNIDFGSLSSGEKVLMCLAFCLYHSKDPRKELSKAKLILFDEIDATLHPSMSRILINTIRDILVKQHGIDVIFVTHSPSTVAVSPDDAIYVLEPSTNKLYHETKRRAISTLTAEIPTLSISFEGRRQVFVESQRDAERYQKLFQIYAPSIQSERSLVFIGVGGRDGAGRDVDNGCDQVKRVVRALAEGGNISVLGLIDWDGRNNALDRIFVLSEGRRYAIENCLLDPLLLGATVFRQHSRYGFELGIPDSVSYAKLEGLDQGRLQDLANVVQSGILGLTLEAIDARPSFASRCRNGGEIKILEEYARMPGHDLAARARSTFQCLNRFKSDDDLLSHVIQQVMRDLPGLAPDDIFETLATLCERKIE